MTPGHVVDAATSRSAPDWDLLAPVWHCWENGGSTWATVADVLDLLTPPVLYLGCGRGRDGARLERWFGPGSVLAVDSSEAMARRARTELGLTVLQADGQALPLQAQSVGSAFCATGVLEYLDADGRRTVLRELARVVRGGGSLVLAGALVDGAVPGTGRRPLPARTLLGSWWDGSLGPSTPFDTVAAELGDRTAAYALLAAALPDRLTGPAPLTGADLAAAGLHAVDLDPVDLGLRPRGATADGTLVARVG